MAIVVFMGPDDEITPEDIAPILGMSTSQVCNLLNQGIWSSTMTACTT